MRTGMALVLAPALVLEELDTLAGLKRDHGLLPVRQLCAVAPPATRLPHDVHGVDGRNLDVRPGPLDGLLDLDLIGARMHLEDVLALLAKHGALLGDAG